MELLIITQGLKIITNDPNLVCRLNISIYGLKQASRTWFTTLKDTINHLEFQQCKSDYSMFIAKKGNSITIILAYVDDLLITRDDLKQILFTKKQLHKHFTIKDLGSLNYFLGL